MPESHKFGKDDYSIYGFADLFRPRSEKSIRFGSTLLLSGPPGAGKTTFALALVRGMMAKAYWDCMASAAPPAVPPANTDPPIVYYVSSEVQSQSLEANFASFGWFGKSLDEDEKFGFKFRVAGQAPDQTNFYAISPALEVDRPVPSPEELVNGIFNRIVRTLMPSEAPRERATVYVIIDSITALLKGCANAGEERRQTHEIMRRLQDRFGDRLALVVLLAEQDHRSQELGITGVPMVPTAPSVEDYVADFVFRLYVRSLPLGRRGRVLEVVKSQGADMRLGEHTWHIICEGNYGECIRLDAFKEDVRKRCLALRDKEISVSNAILWGGVIVFARPDVKPDNPPSDFSDGGLQNPMPGSFPMGPSQDGSIAIVTPARETNGKSLAPEKANSLGTPLGTGDTRNARPAQDADASNPTGTEGLHVDVSDGRVTLIAGPMGCGKTKLCTQFLKRNSTDKRRRVLISFDISNQQEITEADSTKFESLFFSQSQFDLNVLTAHINWILNRGCERLAFDGLSEWLMKFDKPEAARVLEALMLTVKRQEATEAPRATNQFDATKKTEATNMTPSSGKPGIPAVFMTYEMPLNEDPLDPAVLAATTDNLVVVRKVPINDELRRVIYVLKYAGQKPQGDKALTHQFPGELVSNRDKKVLSIDPTSLEAFTGLLSPTREVKPARVLVQLFAENRSEEKFNRKLKKRLKQQLAARIELTFTRFDLSEIGTTLETAFQAGKPAESFNLAIHSVDEWWLKARQTHECLDDLAKSSPQRAASSAVTSNKAKDESASAVQPRLGPHHADFWWFEVEKALTPSKNQGRSWHAVPGYLDFGMFCINLNAVEDKDRVWGDLSQRFEPHEQHPPSLREQWKKILSAVPRQWVRQRKLTFPQTRKVNGQAEENNLNQESVGENKVLTKIEWFTINPKSNKPTVLDYALRVTGQADRKPAQRDPVFTFDSSTRETCSCLFFELAWTFGASEGLLANENRDADRGAAERALRFLQFMVLEGLMLARCSPDSPSSDGKPILFSRHWYSTFRKITEGDDAQKEKGESSENPSMEKRQQRLSGLVAIPFMPGGDTRPKETIKHLLDDIIARQKRWHQRARYHCQIFQNKTSEELIPLDEVLRRDQVTNQWRERLRTALDAYLLSRKWLLEMAFSSNSEAATNMKADANAKAGCEDWGPDLDDLTELGAWMAFRLQLLFGGGKGKFLAAPAGDKSAQADRAIDSLYARGHSLPDLKHLTNEINTFDLNKVVATGYGCSGSWMYGVDIKSRSSQISARILSELTSLDAAHDRVATGAGMPARKDFFQLSGHQPVKGMEYLRWRELFRYGGSRARRRDGVLIERTAKGSDQRISEDPSRLYGIIYDEMLACLRIAELCREEYQLVAETGGNPGEIVSRVTERATIAIKRIHGVAEELNRLVEPPKGSS